MEIIVLSNPEVQQTVNAEYHVGSVSLDQDARRVIVIFRGANGESREWRIEGDATAPWLAVFQLPSNPTDPNSKSLNRQLLEAALTNNVFVGTVSSA